MEVLKYTVIKSKAQYEEYCNTLETMVTGEGSSEDEIDLLTVLIEKWDAEHNTFKDANPVELLVMLMQEHNMSATKLAGTLGVSKGLVSDILNYKKGFSKETIRALADLFKVSQEAFNRPYALAAATSTVRKKAFVQIDDIVTGKWGAAKQSRVTHTGQSSRKVAVQVKSEDRHSKLIKPKYEGTKSKNADHVSVRRSK